MIGRRASVGWWAARIALGAALAVAACSSESPAPWSAGGAGGVAAGGSGGGPAGTTTTSSAVSSGSGLAGPGGGAPHPDNGPECPAVRPSHGDDCDWVWDDGPVTCAYSSGCSETGCEVRCIADQWLVSCAPCEATSPSCPAEPPAHESSCLEPMDPNFWCFYDSCDEGGFAWARCSGEHWEVNHSLCGWPEPGCIGFIGETPASCMDNTLCVTTSADAVCTPHPSWECPSNPCVHEPLSCACAGTICGPYLECVDVTPSGWVTCELPPPGPNPPVKLAPIGSIELVISNTHAYWIGAAINQPPAIQRVSLSGGSYQTFVPISGPQLRQLAIDESYLYLAEGDALRRFALSNQEEVVLATGLPNPYHLTLGTDVLAWEGSSDILLIPKSGGVATFLASEPGVVGVDDSHVFTLNATVKAWPLVGGSPMVISSVGGHTIALDETWVYFTQKAPIATEGRVYKVLKTGGTPVLLASNQYLPDSIAVDATHVYYAAGTTIIMRVPKLGGVPEVFVGGHYHPRFLTADDTHLYWMNEPPCGSVWKKAK